MDIILLIYAQDWAKLSDFYQDDVHWLDLHRLKIKTPRVDSRGFAMVTWAA